MKKTKLLPAFSHVLEKEADFDTVGTSFAKQVKIEREIDACLSSKEAQMAMSYKGQTSPILAWDGRHITGTSANNAEDFKQWLEKQDVSYTLYLGQDVDMLPSESKLSVQSRMLRYCGMPRGAELVQVRAHTGIIPKTRRKEITCKSEDLPCILAQNLSLEVVEDEPTPTNRIEDTTKVTMVSPTDSTKQTKQHISTLASHTTLQTSSVDDDGSSDSRRRRSKRDDVKVQSNQFSVDGKSASELSSSPRRRSARIKSKGNVSTKPVTVSSKLDRSSHEATITISTKSASNTSSSHGNVANRNRKQYKNQPSTSSVEATVPHLSTSVSAAMINSTRKSPLRKAKKIDTDLGLANIFGPQSVDSGTLTPTAKSSSVDLKPVPENSKELRGKGAAAASMRVMTAPVPETNPKEKLKQIAPQARRVEVTAKAVLQGNLLNRQSGESVLLTPSHSSVVSDSPDKIQCDKTADLDEVSQSHIEKKDDTKPSGNLDTVDFRPSLSATALSGLGDGGNQPQSESSSLTTTPVVTKSGFVQEKLHPINMEDILTATDSALLGVDLREVLSVDAFVQDLQPQDRATLYSMLPETDRADGAAIVKLFRHNMPFISSLTLFKRLLAAGVFDPNQISKARNKRRRTEGWSDEKEKELERRYALRIDPAPANKEETEKWKELDKDVLSRISQGKFDENPKSQNGANSAY